MDVGERGLSGHLQMVLAWFAESDFQRDTFEASHPTPHCPTPPLLQLTHNTTKGQKGALPLLWVFILSRVLSKEPSREEDE